MAGFNRNQWQVWTGIRFIPAIHSGLGWQVIIGIPTLRLAGFHRNQWQIWTGIFISPMITQELYEKVMGKNPSAIKNPKAPVTNVSMIDAMDFCCKLSTLDNIDSAYSTDGYKM